MHELFITAGVPAEARLIGETLAVIQAYTHMTPVQIFKRKIDFKGPKGPQDGAYISHTIFSPHWSKNE